MNSKCGHQQNLLGTEPKGAVSGTPSRLPLPPHTNRSDCSTTTSFGQQHLACPPSVGQRGSQAEESQHCLSGHTGAMLSSLPVGAGTGAAAVSGRPNHSAGPGPGSQALPAHPRHWWHTQRSAGHSHWEGTGEVTRLPMGGRGQRGPAGKCPLLRGSASSLATHPAQGDGRRLQRPPKPLQWGTRWGTGEATGTRGRGAAGRGLATRSASSPSPGSQSCTTGRRKRGAGSCPNEGSLANSQQLLVHPCLLRLDPSQAPAPLLHGLRLFGEAEGNERCSALRPACSAARGQRAAAQTSSLQLLLPNCNSFSNLSDFGGSNMLLL